MIGIAGWVLRSVALRWDRLLRKLPNPAVDDTTDLLDFYVTQGVRRALDLDDAGFRRDVRRFVESMKAAPFEYRYAARVASPTLYGSAYACLIMSLLDDIGRSSAAEREAWAQHLDSFQSEEDGLFRDPLLRNHIFETSDSWGARHLVVHLVTAYAALGARPRYRFAFLDEYRRGGRNDDPARWTGDLSHRGDIDNRIMNVVCALQYERDFRGDDAAGAAVQTIRDYLHSRRNEATAMWGPSPSDARSRSRAVQFAYHLYLPDMYDGVAIEGADRIIDECLSTQNMLGGFGAQPNASACEDIDALDLLIRLSAQTTHRADEVERAIRRALVWILSNQNADGGFVFRRNEPFVYGHRLMSSGRNESALFPTWFRTLSVAYAMTWLGVARYNFVRCPGYQFPLPAERRANGVGDRHSALLLRDVSVPDGHRRNER